MRAVLSMAALLALGLAAGCSDLSRSRDLGNPAVPAVTLAQQVCVNCHGVAGQSISPNFPHLAAQTPEYIEAQLRYFRSHDRADPEGFEYMWGLSRSLTDEQVHGLAAYFSSQPAVTPQAVGTSESRARGDKLFHTASAAGDAPACAACHGEHGQGQGTFPRLAGQHREVLLRQLEVIRDTTQRPASAIMKPAAHGLSNQDMHDVADWLQGQSG